MNTTELGQNEIYKILKSMSIKSQKLFEIRKIKFEIVLTHIVLMKKKNFFRMI